jgi:hypothetical protein
MVYARVLSLAVPYALQPFRLFNSRSGLLTFCWIVCTWSSRKGVILSFPSVMLESFHSIEKSFDALQGDCHCIRQCQKAYGANYMI